MYSYLKHILASCTILAIGMQPIQAQQNSVSKTKDLVLNQASVRYIKSIDMLVFELKVEGRAGHTVPEPAGEMDGAPVLGYVFPTTLNPNDVGFSSDQGIVALAATSHPDFDDTPLWDENNNNNFGDDGIVFHTHWVLLGPDERVAGGLSVIEIKKEDTAQVLPPTAPGMPMYLDSPGFPVKLDRKTLQIAVPGSRVKSNVDFKYDGVTAYMEVNTSDESRPLLGVYEVYSVMSGDLSLPYAVKHK